MGWGGKERELQAGILCTGRSAEVLCEGDERKRGRTGHRGGLRKKKRKREKKKKKKKKFEDAEVCARSWERERERQKGLCARMPRCGGPESVKIRRAKIERPASCKGRRLEGALSEE